MNINLLGCSFFSVNYTNIDVEELFYNYKNHTEAIQNELMKNTDIRPTISVVTLVRNRRKQLVNLMHGLAKSTVYPEELVIIYMNEMPYKKLPQMPFPIQEVVHRNTSDDIPLAEARNLAARRSSGDIILFLDVDCIPSASMLADMIKAQSEKAGLIMGEVRYLPENAVCNNFTETDLRKVGVPHPRRPQVPNNGRLEMKDYGYFWSLCFSISRENFYSLGGFDEAYRNYGAEDTDFGFKAREANIPFSIIDSLCFHQYHAVCRPPLNNFACIVENAMVFKEKWGHFAMEKWLQEFKKEGFISYAKEDKVIEILRIPTKAEVAAAVQDTGAGF